MARRRYARTLSNRTGAVRRELAAAFGMLAIVLNLLAGFALSSRPVLAMDSSGALYGSAICGSGFFDQQDGDAESNKARVTGAHCVFCLPLLSGSLLAAAGIVKPLRIAVRQFLPPASSKSHALRKGRGPPPSRGPPAV